MVPKVVSLPAFVAGCLALASAAAQAGEACQGNGPDDEMVRVGPLCVDKYEASIWSRADGGGDQFGASKDDYPGTFPANGNWTVPLYAVSKRGVLPARYLTWFQAQQACAAAGKRLLSNAEWQMAAAGTPDGAKDDGKTSCVTTQGVAPTGTREQCRSRWGAQDMVGNVAEWVADWGHSGNEPWAPTGHTATTNAAYGEDLIIEVLPSHVQGDGRNFPSAWVRGGSYMDARGAGVFALDMSHSPSHHAPVVANIGFRCAR